MRFVLMVMTGVTLAACGPPNPNPDGGVPDGGEAGAPLVLSTLDENGATIPLTGDAFAIPGSQGGFHVNVLYTLPEGGVGEVTFEHRVVRERRQAGQYWHSPVGPGPLSSVNVGEPGARQRLHVPDASGHRRD